MRREAGLACSIHAAPQRGLFITIPIRIEDYRQRSWLVDLKDLTAAEILPLIMARPRARFVLPNGAGYTASALGKKEGSLPANYWIEISRLSTLMASEIGSLAGVLGAGRIVFGTGMPFNAPEPALAKIEVLEMSRSDKDRILWQDAARLEDASR